jgi:hypothetical protein
MRESSLELRYAQNAKKAEVVAPYIDSTRGRKPPVTVLVVLRKSQTRLEMER